MLCSLPQEILSNIISNLDVSSRLNLRRTCRMMDKAVTKSDLRLDTIQIERDKHKRVTLTFDNVLTMTVGSLSIQPLIQMKQKLFRKAFARRVVLSLHHIDDETEKTVLTLLEGCTFHSVEYYLFNGSFTEPSVHFLDGFICDDLHLFLHNTEVDAACLLSFTRSVHIYEDGDLRRELSDDLYEELHDRGHHFEYVASPKNFNYVLETVAALKHRQSIHYYIHYSYVDKTLIKFGVALNDKYELNLVKKVDGVKFTDNLYRSLTPYTIEYKGVRMELDKKYRILGRNAPDAPWTIKVANFEGEEEYNDDDMIIDV